jgi:hypothetical protein
MYRLALVCILAAGCYPADFVTSQGAAIFIEGWDWVDVEINESAWGIEFTDPNKEMFENAFDFLIEHAPEVWGVSRKDMKWAIRYSRIYIYPEKSSCPGWGLCSGCNFGDGRINIKWYGDIWCSPLFHEYFHFFTDKPHGIAGKPDSPNDPVWEKVDEMNELYRITLGNLKEN